KIPDTASPRLRRCRGRITRSGESLQDARGADAPVDELIQHRERPAAIAYGRRTQTDAAWACFRSATWRVRRGDQVRAGSARVPVVPATICRLVQGEACSRAVLPSSSGRLSVNLRNDSRARDSRERMVPTGTLRTTATSS